MDASLRSEVRFVTTRLGNIIREQCGRQVFDAVENLRRLSKQLRQSHDTSLFEAEQAQLDQLRASGASSVAHAFSLFFHLVNLCEERQRVRRLRAYQHQEAGARMSLRHTFHELRRQKISPQTLNRLLRTIRVEPVLTAHPTEAKRRSVVNHILRIGRALEEINGDFGPEAERLLDRSIEALWLTDEIRERAVTPAVEVENVLVYLERTIFDLPANFFERLREELVRFAPAVQPPGPFLAFGSWVGADRDGNPNVTPETSVEAAEQYRRSILGHYLARCRHMMGVLSLPVPPGPAGRKLAKSVAADMERFPGTRVFEQVDQPSELYRRKLRIMMWRLERTAERSDGAYRTPDEFGADLDIVRDALAKQPAPRLTRWGPQGLRTTRDVFGFHAVTLDFRQHSGATRAAAEEILRAAALPVAPPDERIRSIHRLIQCPPSAVELSGAAQATLAEFEALRRIQELHGEEAAHRYILSMASSASDVWDVLLLGWQSGMVRATAKGLQSSFDIIPLFETYDDLHACPETLDGILSDPAYLRLLQSSRHNFQEVMLGYSDSVKDSGYIAANWALFRAQKRMSEVAERHRVQLSLFHGKGGTIDRGGGLSYRMVQAQPFAAPGGRMRITEQGEVISFKYKNPEIALRNIEELVTSVLDAHLLHPRRQLRAARIARWEGFMEEMAVASRAYYTQLVYESPDFPKYFFQATPIDLIERLRLGSRPPRRSQSNDIRSLRAIPWVFAWTQCRHFLPSWYGAGYALERFVAHDRGLELLREMYKSWPFFTVLVDNLEVSLAKTDLAIGRRYAELVRPRELGQRVFKRIEQEYQRSRSMVLAITEMRELLENQPVLAESIRLRNPYVDPLNFLQLRFLQDWRNSRRPPGDVLHLLQITVSGIAFGMKSTG